MLPFIAARAALGSLPWKVIGFAALGMFILGLMLALSMERRQGDKLKAQVSSLNGELQRIRDAAVEQIKTTDRSIAKGRVIVADGERRARRVEQAPLPGSCKTPPEIMSEPNL